MVSAGSTGSLCALVPRQPGVCESGQHQQYDGQYDHGHEHLERHVCEPECTRCGDGGSTTRLCECAACGPGSGCGERAANCGRACECESSGRPDTGERTGREGRDPESCDRTAARSNEQAGDREDDSTSSAGAVCKTAAGTCRTSGTAFGEARSADVASGRHGGGCTADGQGGTSGQTGDTHDGPSRKPARES